MCCLRLAQQLVGRFEAEVEAESRARIAALEAARELAQQQLIVQKEHYETSLKVLR